PGRTSADDMGGGGGGNMPGGPARVIPASEDVNQLETGRVEQYTLQCALQPTRWCSRAASGPFVLTDLQGTAFVAESDEQIRTAGFKPRWITQITPLGNPIPQISGLRLFVRPNEKLYVTAAAPGNDPPLVPVLWSGYHPY